jgi:hypothetical protein
VLIYIYNKNYIVSVVAIDWFVSSIIFGHMQCISCITSDDFINDTLYNIVACLLKIKIVKPAEAAVARDRLCKHLVPRQWLSSRHVMAAADTYATI